MAAAGLAITASVAMCRIYQGLTQAGCLELGLPASAEKSLHFSEVSYIHVQAQNICRIKHL